MTTTQINSLTLAHCSLCASYSILAHYQHAGQWSSHHTTWFQFWLADVRPRLFLAGFQKSESGTLLLSRQWQVDLWRSTDEVCCCHWLVTKSVPRLMLMRCRLTGWSRMTH